MQLIQTIDRTPFYYERISVTALEVARLNQTYREDANAVFITIESNDIRYRIDGGNPSAVEGHPVYDTQNIYVVDRKSIRNMRMIGNGGTATAIVTYYK